MLNLDYQEPVEITRGGSTSQPKGDFKLYSLEGNHLIKRNQSNKSQASSNSQDQNLPQMKTNLAKELPGPLTSKQRSTSINTKLILLKVDSVVKKGEPVATRVGRFEAEL